MNRLERRGGQRTQHRDGCHCQEPHRYGEQPQPTCQAVASERFPGNPCVCGGLVEKIERNP